MSEKEVKAGTLLAFSTGAYSDYSITGFFVVLKGFDAEKVYKEYVNSINHPDEIVRVHINGAKFLAYLLELGLFLEISFSELHVDDYGEEKDFYFAPAKEQK